MRTLPVAACVVVMILAGCTQDSDGPSPTSATASADVRPGKRVPVTIFLGDKDSNLLVGVPVAVPPRVNITTSEARTTVAVEALMARDSRKGKAYSTAWGPLCSPGRGVKSITATSELVVVTLAGSGGATCDLSSEGATLQGQQLAWTVVQNLGTDPATPVRLMSDGGHRHWEDDVVADQDYVARSTD